MYVFLMNHIFYSPDGDEGATGNADTKSGDGGAEKETVTQPVKFGNIEVDFSTKEGQDAAIKAYENAVKYGNDKSQELSKVKKEQTKVEPKKVETTKSDDLQNQRFNKIYERGVNTDIENLIKSESERYSKMYGENFKTVEEGFSKDVETIKGFDLEVKEAILEKGNFDVLINKALANSLTAIKPKVDTSGTKKDINSFEGQEKLPPQPDGKGQANIPGEIDVEKELKGDTKFKKAAEMSKRSRAIRSGEGVR